MIRRNLCLWTSTRWNHLELRLHAICSHNEVGSLLHSFSLCFTRNRETIFKTWPFCTTSNQQLTNYRFTYILEWMLDTKCAQHDFRTEEEKKTNECWLFLSSVMCLMCVCVCFCVVSSTMFCDFRGDFPLDLRRRQRVLFFLFHQLHFLSCARPRRITH